MNNTWKLRSIFFIALSVVLLGVLEHYFCQVVVASPTKSEKQTHIVMLGTGTPNAEHDRSGPGVAIVVNKKAYLIDFGPGIVRQMSAAYAKGVKALHPSVVRTVFCTHLHSDHTAGYSDLILTPAVIGRRRPLEVFGPNGIKEMTTNILKAYKKDIDVRLSGLEPASRKGYEINTHEIKPGLIYQDDRVRVTAFQVNHGSWDEAYGFRFETPDRTIIISGDTAPYPGMIEDYKDCDVLIHEVYTKAGLDLRTQKWQLYHSSFHTSGVQLGEIAAKVNPKLLILYHQLFWGKQHEDILQEVRGEFKGKVVSANDLDIF